MNSPELILIKRQYKVSRFKVSLLLGVKASKFRRFKVSKFQEFIQCLGKILIPYYHIPILCFLEDIDPIIKIFQTYEMDLQDLAVPACSNILKIVDSQIFAISKNITSPKRCPPFSVIFRVSPKINIFISGRHGHVRESRNHENDGGCRFS